MPLPSVYLSHLLTQFHQNPINPFRMHKANQLIISAAFGYNCLNPNLWNLRMHRILLIPEFYKFEFRLNLLTQLHQNPIHPFRVHKANQFVIGTAFGNIV